MLAERIELTVSTEIDLTKIETTALKHQIPTHVTMALQSIMHSIQRDETQHIKSAAAQRQTSNTTKNKKTEKIEGKEAKLRSD